MDDNPSHMPDDGSSNPEANGYELQGLLLQWSSLDSRGAQILSKRRFTEECKLVGLEFCEERNLTSFFLDFCHLLLQFGGFLASRVGRIGRRPWRCGRLTSLHSRLLRLYRDFQAYPYLVSLYKFILNWFAPWRFHVLWICVEILRRVCVWMHWAGAQSGSIRVSSRYRSSSLASTSGSETETNSNYAETSVRCSRRQGISLCAASILLGQVLNPGSVLAEENAKKEDGGTFVDGVLELLDPDQVTKGGKKLPKKYVKSVREVVKNLRESFTQDSNDGAKFRRSADSAKEAIREYLQNWRGSKIVETEVSSNCFSSPWNRNPFIRHMNTWCVCILSTAFNFVVTIAWVPTAVFYLQP